MPKIRIIVQRRSLTSYERIRAKLPNDEVCVYDLLDDSVDAGVCRNC
jgi:hypothetical protein